MRRCKGYVGKTDYSNVYELESGDTQGRKMPNYFEARKVINGSKYRVVSQTAKGAAMALDIKLIESGMEPVNVLKRK